jgi:hypothetical protein
MSVIRESCNLALSGAQRSHILFVLSDAVAGREVAFREWYLGRYRHEFSVVPGLLGVQHYEQHETDVTQGRFPRLPFLYLGICELSVDGATAATALIERIGVLHRGHAAARAPATWLYYPVSEKVGRSPTLQPSVLTIAFANSVAGQESEFREWYATRHIRHALNIPSLVSGQCYERTQFQAPGALEARFQTIAVYETEGGPDDIIREAALLPASTFHFPMLDLSRFAESVYRPLLWDLYTRGGNAI